MQVSPKRATRKALLVLLLLSPFVGLTFYYQATEPLISVVPERLWQEHNAPGLARAIEVMGSEQVLGPAEVERVFGVHLAQIPPIPFTEEQLARAKDLDQQLILQVDTMRSKGLLGLGKTVPLTLENIEKRFTRAHSRSWGPLFHHCLKAYIWCDESTFFLEETPRVGWRLATKDTVLQSRKKSQYADELYDYLDRTEALILYIEQDVFSGQKPPPEYQLAIEEFRRLRPWFEENILSDRDAVITAAGELRITKLARPLAVEVVYQLLLQNDSRNETIFMQSTTDTATTFKNEYSTAVITVGNADWGISVSDILLDGGGNHIGTSYSDMGE